MKKIILIIAITIFSNSLIIANNNSTNTNHKDDCFTVSWKAVALSEMRYGPMSDHDAMILMQATELLCSASREK
tara:strand:- start:1565 stop:1786 length:222 start_codon:yes stop_codon:yes gene_type:complete